MNRNSLAIRKDFELYIALHFVPVATYQNRIHSIDIDLFLKIESC